MAEFRESEHPRNNDGKFKDKDNQSVNKKEEFIKKYSSEPERDNSRKERAIRHLRKRIDEHKDKMKNPQNYVKDCDNRSEEYKKEIVKYWKKEIINYYNQINNMR